MKKVIVAFLVIVSVLCSVACTAVLPTVSDGRKTDKNQTGEKSNVTFVTGNGKTEEEVIAANADVDLDGIKDKIDDLIDNIKPGDLIDAASEEIDSVNYAHIGYIEYGNYPQTVASKQAVKQMSEATDNTGYYISAYDNAHYARLVVSNVYGNKYEFNNEMNIIDRSTYYFKVEPIKWQVFGQADLSGSSFIRIYLVSDLILDSAAYLLSSDYSENPADLMYYHRTARTLANDWENSNLRSFLNETFYREAFSAKEKKQLVEKQIGENTDEEGNSVAVTDKVFALTASQAKVLADPLATLSDYARCRGTWMSIYPAFYGKGRWWLSTQGDTSYRASYVGADKNNTVNESGESVGASYMGVRPAIMLNVETLEGLLLE